MNTYAIALDLDKSVCAEHVTLRRGDAGGATILASVTDHGSAIEDTVDSAYLVLEGNGWLVEIPATYDGGTVTSVITDPNGILHECVDAFGYMRLVTDGATYSTSQFDVDVLDGGYE